MLCEGREDRGRAAYTKKTYLLLTTTLCSPSKNSNLMLLKTDKIVMNRKNTPAQLIPLNNKFNIFLEKKLKVKIKGKESLSV